MISNIAPITNIDAKWEPTRNVATIPIAWNGKEEKRLAKTLTISLVRIILFLIEKICKCNIFQARNVLFPEACQRVSGLVKRRSCPSLELLSWMRVPRPTQVSDWWIQVKSIVTNLHKLFVKHLKTRDRLMKWNLIYKLKTNTWIQTRKPPDKESF